MASYEDLEGKVALVTGGSGDLGKAITRELCRQKCKVYFTYNNSQEAADELAEAVAGEGGHAIAVACNVQDKASVRNAIEHILGESGKIEILVNNAGKYRDNLFSSLTDHEFDDVIQTNLYGTYYCTKAVVGSMIKEQRGAIVNIASIAGLTGSFGQSNYSAAKGAIAAFGRTLAAELAQKNIRVNTLAPGMIDSSMVKRIPRNLMKATLANIPCRRLGKAEEIARFVAFLVSTDSEYMVGQTLVVDGGLVMR